jgi:hypothetical protein
MTYFGDADHRQSVSQDEAVKSFRFYQQILETAIALLTNLVRQTA